MPIYLDYNATTPPLPDVIDIVTRTMRDSWGNASSIHARGQHAKQILDAARQAVAALLACAPVEVVFTSGGTEADGLAVRGTLDALAASGRRHVVTTAIEHEAVLQTVRALGKRGVPHTIVPVDAQGRVNPADVTDALRDDTALVSVMLANNEIGTLQPVAEIAAAAHARGAFVHTDAVQAAGKVALDVRDLGVDLLSISAHKFGGPSGVGALYVKRGTPMHAQQTGGRQERSRRAGTENVAGLAGLGVAADHAGRAALDTTRVRALRDALELGILTRVAGTHVNGAGAPRVANTANIGFAGVDAEALLIALDLEGIAVSTGAACSSGTLEPSHVLRAMGLTAHDTQNALRFSLGAATTEAEIARVVDVVDAAVSRLRRVAEGRRGNGKGRCG